MKEIFISLSLKINLLIFFILLLFLAFPLLFLVNNIEKELFADYDRHGKEIGVLFSKINTLALWRTDYFTLINNSKELLNNQDIAKAEVIEGKNFICAKSEKANMSHHNLKLFSQPILSPENFQQIGSIKIYISQNNLLERIKYIKIFMSSVFFISALLIYLAMTLGIKLLVNRPLNQLLNFFHRITSGNLNDKISIRTHDEMALLAKNFNQMSETLQKNLFLINQIFESMPSLMIVMDSEGKIVKINSRTALFSGMSESDAISKNIFEIITEFKPYRHFFVEVIRQNRAQNFHAEFVINQETKHFNIHLFPVHTTNESLMGLRADDVTDLEQKETQIRQMQKMETVGTLAGGLAHDFNNVLGGIVGTLSLVRYKINKKINIEDLSSYLDIIEESGKRATDMVQQLLTLSRRQELILAPVDLNLSIKHVLKICNNTFDKSVEIITFFEPGCAMTSADPTQMEQVFLNICVNAYHGMTIMRKENEHQGGKLTIAIEKMKTDAYFSETHPESESNMIYWKISFSDNGVGIEKKNLAKIFEPFFTTKAKGSGTGLGLAMVYNIIRSHKGFIDVYSEVNLGTSFNIFLPQITDDNSLLKNDCTDLIVEGTGLILIVDDEEVMRNLAKEILTTCGYEYLFAENGEEAIEIYKANKDKIKLVLLDMVMPKKSGKEAYDEIVKINPKVKVLLSSGFRQDDRVQKLLDLGIDGFIQKPYTLTNLSKIVHKITTS